MAGDFLIIALPIDVAKAVREALEDKEDIRPIAFAIKALDDAAQKALRQRLKSETDAEHPVPHV